MQEKVNSLVGVERTIRLEINVTNTKTKIVNNSSKRIKK